MNRFIRVVYLGAKEEVCTLKCVFDSTRMIRTMHKTFLPMCANAPNYTYLLPHEFVTRISTCMSALG